MKTVNQKYQLSNGVLIPKIGFGTWQIPNGDVAYQAVSLALKSGYRHIDTAHAYMNEESVGKAIKDSKIGRKEIFITSKLRAEYKDYTMVRKYFLETLTNLGVDYLDLYLIHAPWPWNNQKGDFKKENILIWQEMIKLYEEGKIKAIGVSNFNKDQIEYLYEATKFYPHVNQIALFIGLNQEETRNYCQNNNILVEAYSPLGIGYALKNPIIINMASKYQVTPAQICLRYCIEKKTLPLPKSIHESRMIENTMIDFTISKEDLKVLDSIKDDPRKWE